jgi:hypothetical protein
MGKAPVDDNCCVLRPVWIGEIGVNVAHYRTFIGVRHGQQWGVEVIEESNLRLGL